MINHKIEIQLPEPLVGLFPVPVVLVTTVDSHGKQNIMTAGWVGVACSEPPMISLAVRPSRYSYELIKSSGEFVINIPTGKILNEVDYCGKVSGRDIDKFQKTGLRPLLASKVHAPLIEQCPFNLECKVRSSLLLGSHELFISEVMVVHIDSKLKMDNNNKYNIIKYENTNLFVANLYEYWRLDHKIGNVYKVNERDKY